MNFCSFTAQLTEDPREVYVSATAVNVRCFLKIPRVGSKAPTVIEFHSYGKNSERFLTLKKDDIIYIHGAKLRYDLDTRTHSLHGGVAEKVTQLFPLLNTVILTGRCVKDVSQDARAFKTTADGLMICQQTLSVYTGRNQADLFNFYAINSSTDALNNAELLMNFTKKGTGLTLMGRLVTDEWVDKDSREKKQQSKIQLVSMTLAPKGTEPQQKPITSQTTVASDSKVTSLWADRAVAEEDPWTQASGGGLPDLPGHYGAAPELSADPF